MAHFAELDENNIVKRVIVVSNNDTTNANGIEEEAVGVSFCRSLFGEHTNWKQTSYNHKFRRRYAGIGMIYNEEYDAFVVTQPFSSWSLNAETLDWDPPTPMPELTEEEIASSSFYVWDESAYNENGQGWTLFTPEPLPESESEPEG